MATVKNWLRGAKGKLAGMVLYKNEGKTAIRENVTPKNPKTRAQALQRAIFATVAKAAADLDNVVNNSFDGYKNGVDSRREFVRANLANLRSLYLDDESNVVLSSRGSLRSVPNRLIVSRGKLGTIIPDEVDSNGSWLVPGGLMYSLRDFQRLNPNIKAGSQITIVGLYGSDDIELREWRYGRFVIGSWVGLNDYLVTTVEEGKYYLNKSVLVDSKTEGFGVPNEIGYSITSADSSSARPLLSMGVNEQGVYGLVFGDPGEDYNALAATIIVSNYDADKGVWEHSESILAFQDRGVDYPNNDDVPIPSYMSSAVSTRTSDAYTEQSSGSSLDNYYSSANYALQGVQWVQGVQPKSINFEAANTYGPVAEGSNVFMEIVPNADVKIVGLTSAKIGENDIDAHAVKNPVDGRLSLRFKLPAGTANSYQLNLTLQAQWNDQQWTVAFRDTVSVVQG